MKKVTTYLFLPPLIGLLLFVYGFSLDRNQHKKVKNIEVEFDAGTNSFLTHESVNKLLIQNETTVKNQPKSVIDLYSLENSVLSNPYVEKATVFLTPDGLLKTQIKQREPIARIVDVKEDFYVDKQGGKMPLSINFSARVPLVSGVKSSEEIRELTQLAKVISEDDFLHKEVVGIHKTTFNEYVFNVRSGDFVIDFGKFDHVDVKIKKLKAFYNKALSDNTIKEYKKINVKYHNQVVCTKQQ
ncbi:cell division protein FtsQ [Tenacibaculum sp. IB213877]|uniref:cell division protein FtsQ/DivIB n=1 Tax=Tenacibaculum sp. IB213877 TaxID=3097351 RepID=UPI002A59FA2D|nr:cell division protein FtsQ [Tenacibaculum sp. IB213877]MDY0780733.1 cell division protein FtsQ [Tenacibaculum sp. IB213877]